jgi:hypothetical protein
METTLGSAAFRTQLFNPGDVENCKEVMAGCKGQRLGVPRPPDPRAAYATRRFRGAPVPITSVPFHLLLRSMGPLLHSPSRCALAVAYGDSSPPLACGRRRFLTSFGGASFPFSTSLRARDRLRRLPSALACGRRRFLRSGRQSSIDDPSNRESAIANPSFSIGSLQSPIFSL